MKKYKVIKTIAGYYLALILGGGLYAQISPSFPSVGRLAAWVDNYPDSLIITK